jgi:hypothetical protein
LIAFKKFFKDEGGAVQLTEAALVYPVVMMAVILFIYIGIYVFETAYLYDMAKMTAVTAAKTISFAGYDELGDIYSVYDFITDGSFPEKEQVNNAYKDNRPYRYIINDTVDSRFSEAAEKYAEGLIYQAHDVQCNIDVRQHMFSREVKVNIEKSVSFPGFFRMFGIGNEQVISVCASAFTSDPAEFVRNTDIAVNTGIDEKLSGIREKVTAFIEKLKTGG